MERQLIYSCIIGLGEDPKAWSHSTGWITITKSGRKIVTKPRSTHRKYQVNIIKGIKTCIAHNPEPIDLEEIKKYQGPLSIEIHHYFKIPKYREKELKENDWHAQKPDAINTYKLSEDCLKKLLIRDDCQNCAAYSFKRWSNYPRIEYYVFKIL